MMKKPLIVWTREKELIQTNHGRIPAREWMEGQRDRINSRSNSEKVIVEGTGEHEGQICLM